MEEILMKRVLALVLSCCFVAALTPSLVRAGDHYTSGVEGLKPATLPPPGFYWKMYNVFYNAELRDGSGHRQYHPVTGEKMEVDLFGWVNRFIWVTDTKILGADLGFDVIIPMLYTNIGAFADHRFGLGDIMIEPFILAWHDKHYDLYVTPGVFIPSGRFDADRPSSPGKDYWTFIMSGGGTFYFDEERTWHAGISLRYEIHTKQHDTDYTRGNDFSFEWGVGKTVGGTTDIGIAGFCQWKITDDSGVPDDESERKFGIGPEITTTIPDWKLIVSLRSLWEFGGRNQPQGNMTTLALTYIF